MSAKHSPGPWFFGYAHDATRGPVPFEYHGPGFYDNPAIHAADGFEVVGCDEYDVFNSYFDGDKKEIRAANIRLLCAAPDLLAALENFKTWHAEHFDDFTPEINAQLLCLANDAAAAIDKAKVTA